MTPFAPTLDSKIFRKYGTKSLDAKVHNKTALQDEIGWPKEPKAPLLCLPAGMSDDLGGKLFREMLPGILSLPVQILVLGKGSASYGSLFTDLSRKERHRIHIVPDEESAVRKMYAAADMALFCEDPTNSAELMHCLSYGVVPISLESSLIEDYNPVQESGNAFLYDAPNSWLCFAALVRAIETHKFPFDWRTIQRHGMETAQVR